MYDTMSGRGQGSNCRVGGVRSHIVYDTVSDRGQGSNCVGWSEKERLKVMLCRLQ